MIFLLLKRMKQDISGKLESDYHAVKRVVAGSEYTWVHADEGTQVSAGLILPIKRAAAKMPSPNSCWSLWSPANIKVRDPPEDLTLLQAFYSATPGQCLGPEIHEEQLSNSLVH